MLLVVSLPVDLCVRTPLQLLFKICAVKCLSESELLAFPGRAVTMLILKSVVRSYS